ncbi:MAG: Trm112 family protein, partial [Candidatus Hodarchaeota archaeon]
FFLKSPVEEEKDLVDIEIINKKTADDKLLVHDTLVRKPSILKDYLDGIKASIEELKPITDLSNEDIKKLLEELIKLGGPVQDLINEASKLNTSQDASILAHIEEKLILLNWFKQSVEIKEGIMSCDNCKRWYPISNTIPQLLPDELRKEEKDKEFLNTWKNKIEDSIVKEGKPFHL